ncbi:MAG: ABC transporter ATP-binding protein [Planctomycetales bacterium]|nr:ABC transporter ATP-binding protein [Planctomycetales bacterium]
MAKVELNNVTQHYGVRPILHDIGLAIESGELVTIVGPNGMGKSTLLATIAGVLSPQKGSVVIDGRRRRGSVEEELAIRRMTVYLPDDPWLPAERTGREFLLAVGRLYDVKDDRLFDHIERLLRLFDLTDRGDWPVRGYSAGQKKKIALASALVTEARLLLLDEPFSGGLDPSGILALKSVLKRLAEREDTTIVMTTPVPELVEELSHRILVLREGKVAAFDTAKGLRDLTQCHGPLAEVLERLIRPDTLEAIEQYWEGRDGDRA